MRQAYKHNWIWLLLVTILFVGNVSANPTDEDYSDSDNNRVARITLVRGDVQVRRAGSQEWEEAAPNLPLVEGDRIATGQDSRVEIQFDRDNFLRLAQDSLLKIVTLNEQSAAVSLPEGTLSLRLGDFDKKRGSFEIDAPDTTIAVEREGLYRVEVPSDQRRGNEMLVTATDGGQARIYTAESGYTVRSNRTARIILSGEDAGNASFSNANSRDSFDDWVAERDDRSTRNRRDDYRGYYDRSIYGADDLNEYGEWIDTASYGRVWRPYRNTTSAYRNWQPYRYGHWRHLRGYGWTWVADEPWGWATYHYGRWVWIDSGWSWCPYEYHDRYSYHARWRPALVVFVGWGSNICWYPIPYNYYYSSNYSSRTVIYNTTIINRTIVVNPTPTPSPSATPIDNSHRILKPPLGISTAAYEDAVTSMSKDGFGRTTKGIVPANEIDAQKAVDAIVSGKGATKTELPIYADNAETKVGRGREVVGKRETLKEAERNLDRSDKIGATPREKGVSVDDQLRDKRIFGNRIPVERETTNTDNSTTRTGVFDRTGTRQPSNTDSKNTDSKNTDSKNTDDDSRPTRRPPIKVDRDEVERNSTESKPVENSRPQPRPRQEERKSDDDSMNRRPQPRQEERPEPRPQPKYDPPPQRSEPKYEPPPQRSEPPRREPQPQPRPEPKREAPPAKSEDNPGKDGRR